jgi:hypothetical protein
MTDEPQRPTPGDSTAWGAYWTAQGMPWLPGTSASKAAKGAALFLGVLTLVFFLPITLLEVGWSAARGGHLPWPALQWAVTTPLGALLLMALCVLVVGPPFVLDSLWQLRQQAAQAIDITGAPLMAWPGPLPTHPQPPWIPRWLGYGRGEQALSLTLLILGTLLAIEQVSVFIASAVYRFIELGRVQCDANGNRCQPTFPVVSWIVVASLFAAMALSGVARSRWLYRVKSTSHVWLRYRDWFSMTPLYYVRPPSVTPEAAAAALARFSSARAVPLARRFFIGVLVVTPYVLLASASFVLSVWLQLHWIPG